MKIKAAIIFILGISSIFLINHDGPRYSFTAFVPGLISLFLIAYSWYYYLIELHVIGLSFSIPGIKTRLGFILFTLSYAISLSFVFIIIKIALDNLINPAIPSSQIDKSIINITSHYKQVPNNLSDILYGSSTPYLQRIFIGFTLALVTGIWEEIYFRGLLAIVFGKNTFIFVLVSGLIFGLFHFDKTTIGIIGITFYGIINAYYYTRIRTIIPAIVSHFMHDAFVFLIPVIARV